MKKIKNVTEAIIWTSAAVISIKGLTNLTSDWIKHIRKKNK